MADAPPISKRSDLPAVRRSRVLTLRRGLHRYSLLAGLLLAFAGLVAFVAPTDPDVWWHLANGKLAAESGVPAHDVYSFTANGRPWLMQEWLTEVVMYGLKSVFGYGALSLFFGLLQAMSGLIVYRLLRHRGAGRITAIVLLLLYLAFGAPSWGVRPQVLSAVFLGAFYLVFMLYKTSPRKYTRLLWLLPPLMLLWTNVHASYFIGIALAGAFVVGELANNYIYRPEEPVPVRPMLVTLAGCMAATLFNPYLLSLWSYPLTYIFNGTGNPLLRYTQEWQSPNFHEPINLLFGLSLVALALVGTTRPAQAVDRQGWRRGLTRRVDITFIIILAAFTLMALQAVRLVPLYGVIALPLLAGGLAGTWPALSDRKETPPAPFEARVNWVVAALGVAALAFMMLTSPQAQIGQEPRTDTAFVYPVGAADYISKMGRSVRMYNDFAWGGYLIYRLYPAQLVFIDGRADMYREGIFDDAMNIQNVGPGWRETLARYGVNLAVTHPDTPLSYALSHEPGWRAAYTDGVSVVYQK